MLLPFLDLSITAAASNIIWPSSFTIKCRECYDSFNRYFWLFSHCAECFDLLNLFLENIPQVFHRSFQVASFYKLFDNFHKPLLVFFLLIVYRFSVLFPLILNIFIIFAWFCIIVSWQACLRWSSASLFLLSLRVLFL